MNNERELKVEDHIIKPGDVLTEGQVSLLKTTLERLLLRTVKDDVKIRKWKYRAYTSMATLIIIVVSNVYFGIARDHEYESALQKKQNRIIEYRLDSVCTAHQMKQFLAWKNVKHYTPEKINSYIRITKGIRLKYGHGKRANI